MHIPIPSEHALKRLVVGLLSIVTGIIIISCQSNKAENSQDTQTNPAAEGFNLEASDPKAIDIADAVMEAQGGRKNWDNTRFIEWNFFGKRNLLWDKHTGKVRIEVPGDSIIYFVNIHTDTGRVYRKGAPINDEDSLQKMVKKAESIWINDAYWLVMPFKLKDSGVTLQYRGTDKIGDTIPAHVLQLTFDNVGRTPQNKYHVYVDTTDNLVKEWAYYKSAEQDTPTAVWPWDNYRQYGRILLSANRSDGKGPKNVSVYSSVPDSVFTSTRMTITEKMNTP